ncbi:unnamed protein product [Paramecium sonneborni]|uniref:Ubiquitin-like domain-containing protein n=1 Tax=Paramecium sonneborni TaxID=65129 RepID=A0A8S1M561_9CILI|nr:unnamed protein product [Paramecium sonneborni]
MISINIYYINIQPQNVQVQVELDKSTLVRELFELFQTTYNIQDPIDQWTCFSSIRQLYLKTNDQVGFCQNDTLTINTKFIPPQEPQKIFINLYINITDGQMKKAFQIQVEQNNSLEELAQSILAYCQLSNLNVATVDLFLFNQPYNDKIKRQKTLKELQLKSDITIEAKIRWIGGL